MTVHLKTQSDLDDAIHALVKQDPRLKPILDRTGPPALRRRQPGFEGLAAIVCGQQLSTASASAIWGRLSAAFTPFDHDAIRKARIDRLGRLGLSAAKIATLCSPRRMPTPLTPRWSGIAASDLGPPTSICCSALAMATPGPPATSRFRKRSRSASD